MQETSVVSIAENVQLLRETISLLEESEGTTHDKNGNATSNRALAYASINNALTQNSMVGIRNSLNTDTNYAKMAKARTYSEQVSLVYKLTHWRASLWGRGFEIRHPHKTVEQAYRNLAKRFDLALSIPELMLDLSVTNNAALIWAAAENSADLVYLKIYKPESTRIEILPGILWTKPSADLAKEIKDAPASYEKTYLNSVKPADRKNAKKLWDAVRQYGARGKYPGYVPIEEKDDEYWHIILGDGGTSRQSYNAVGMQSIFTDIELLKMLVEGDWATAFLIKNMTMLVKVGESITSGPLTGSRRNWPTTKDITNLQTQIEKTGKAQIVYGNHTIQIEFCYPDPAVFSPDKYSAVIDRICTFFGIGQYMILGASGGSSRGASYAAASWNVQAIRTDARQEREIVDLNLQKVYIHPVIKSAAFINDKDIYWHDCFSTIDGQMLKFVDSNFKNLSMNTMGTLQYSTDGFANVKTFGVKEVLVDISALVLSTKIPTNAEPNQFRLFLTPDQIIELLGPPENTFDERGLKEDRQVLNEVTYAKGDGLISTMQATQDLGWRFEDQMAQKARELEIPELIMPAFEKNQGMVMAIVYRAFQEAMDRIDGNGAPGERGRPQTRPEGAQDTNEHPRPSTSSLPLDPNDFAAMTDEELAELKIAVWKSLKDVPPRLKILHDVKLTLTQINAIAIQAEGAKSGGAENGWAVARAHFLDTHHIQNSRWVKNKVKK